MSSNRYAFLCWQYPLGATYDRVKEIIVGIELKKEDPKTLQKLMDLTAQWHLPYEIVHIKKGENFDTEIGYKGLQQHITENFPLARGKLYDL
jgi:hypothetical protein